jgi:hypothetical protein
MCSAALTRDSLLDAVLGVLAGDLVVGVGLLHLGVAGGRGLLGGVGEHGGELAGLEGVGGRGDLIRRVVEDALEVGRCNKS